MTITPHIPHTALAVPSDPATAASPNPFHPGGTLKARVSFVKDGQARLGSQGYTSIGRMKWDTARLGGVLVEAMDKESDGWTNAVVDSGELPNAVEDLKPRKDMSLRPWCGMRLAFQVINYNYDSPLISVSFERGGSRRYL